MGTATVFAGPAINWIPAYAGMTNGGYRIADHIGDITDMIKRH